MADFCSEYIHVLYVAKHVELPNTLAAVDVI